MEEIACFIQKKFDGKVDPYLAISCMTDSEVISLSKDIEQTDKKEKFNYGFNETIKNFIGKKINIFDPDLKRKDFFRKNL